LAIDNRSLLVTAFNISSGIGILFLLLSVLVGTLMDPFSFGMVFRELPAVAPIAPLRNRQNVLLTEVGASRFP
jgi:hypothetical protein